jgi:hypothetical protein
MAFDFTPKFTHGSLSDDFSNDDIINALNDEYNNNADEWNERLPTQFKPKNISLGLWPAGFTYATWIKAQIPGCNFTGCSSGNPFSVPFSSGDKSAFLGFMGSNCNKDEILREYNNQRGSISAVENTYYNLASPEKSFTWENGSLCISDRYNFEGIGDFGGATAATALLGAVLALPGTAAILIGNVLNVLANDYDRETDPFNIWRRGSEEIAQSAPIYLKNCFSEQEICQSNNQLYRCAIRSGKISYDPGSACFNGNSCVEVGNAQPSPILGFPSYAPNVMEITTNEGSLSFGGSSGYPSPFTSFSQQLANTSNSLGAYAMFGGMSGRLIVIPSGTYAGELGFTCQSWYDFNDGTYARDSNGDLYPTKEQWWKTCLKSEMTVRFLPLSSRPLVKVMVATKSFSDNNSPEVFSADYPILTAPLSSITLTTILAALPAATLTLI